VMFVAQALRHLRFLAVFCLLIAMLAVGVGSQTGLLETLLLDGHINSEYDDGLRSTAQAFVAETKFAGRLNVGAPPRDGYLTIAAVDIPDDPGFGHLRCNCTYDGTAILCDTRFLQGFSESLKMDPTDEPNELMKDVAGWTSSHFEKFMWKWIVGHEIGHAVLGHPVGAFQSSANPLKTRDNVLSTDAAFPRDIESAADRFFIAHVPSDQEQFFAWLALSNFIGKEYGSGVLETYKPEVLGDFSVNHNPNRPLRLAPTGGPHPPWLIRALNLVDEVLRVYPAAIDNTGHFAKIRQQLSMDRSGIAGSAFCGHASGKPPGSATASSKEGVTLLWLATNGFANLASVRARRLLVPESAATDVSVETKALLTLVIARAQRIMGNTSAATAALGSVDQLVGKVNTPGATLLTVAAAEHALVTQARDSAALETSFANANRTMNGRTLPPLEALLVHDAMLTLSERAFGANSDEFRFFLNGVARLGTESSVSSEALRLLEQRHQALRTNFRDQPETFVVAALSLARIKAAVGAAASVFAQADTDIGLFDQPSVKDFAAVESLSYGIGRIVIPVDPKVAERFFRRALSANESALRLSPPTDANEQRRATGLRSLHLNQIGYSLILQRDFENALEVLREAVDLGGKVLPPDDAEYATRLHNLGQAFLGVQRYHEAKEAVERALNIRRAKLGADSQRTRETEALLRIITAELK